MKITLGRAMGHLLWMLQASTACCGMIVPCWVQLVGTTMGGSVARNDFKPRAHC